MTDASMMHNGKCGRLSAENLLAYGQCMQLTDEDIREFQVAWQAEFGEALTSAQARHEALVLLELYAAVYGPSGDHSVIEGVKPIDIL